MKIAGLAYIDGRNQLYLKPDTALLVNRKPFFLPHFTQEVTVRPCLAVKIDRMGRSISEKFASRYYNTLAPALNIQAAGMEENQDLGNMTRAVAFDNSFPVGGFMELTEPSDLQDNIEWYLNDEKIMTSGIRETIDKAVAQVSMYITLRTGDIVAVDCCCEPIMTKREDVFAAKVNETENLYCKIK